MAGMGGILVVKTDDWGMAMALHGGKLHFLLQLHHVFPEEAVRIHQVFDRLAGVNDRGMVATAEMFADRFQGIFGESFGQVHSDLPRLNDFAFAGFLQ